MSIVQRVKNVFIGLIMIVFALLLVILGETGYPVIVAILGISLAVSGIGTLIYYFRMAKRMVGGRFILYQGIFILDVGAFTLTLITIPKNYIMIYLLGVAGFTGVVLILRGLEAKSNGAPAWKWKFAEGLILLVFSIVCGKIVNTESAAVYLFAIGIGYSAIVKIISAFRKGAIVYIQ